uniref:sodium-independent sulfate anion transporter isoform X5 n=1 Tax=Gasterosteus aculeatus aculeatus TaxID=481459 RepID=UPI001A97FC6F|nr:sodium-independent sulfate anion transporter isoform X5 [Gasterosteus aculeatus aculeatus]
MDQPLLNRLSVWGCCSCSTLKAWLPILTWLPRYKLKWLQMDLLAGLTVGLTTVPQALAYAEVAGLPVQYGLYSAFMGGFIYTLLGTSKDVTLGPTAIMSLLCFSVVGGQPHRAVLLSLLCGLIQAGMALLRLGFLLDFISFPVIKGFTCAAAVTIGFGQVKNILGLQGVPHEFFLEVYYTFYKIPEARTGDVVLGLLCLAVLIMLLFMKESLGAEGAPTCPAVARKLVWTVATVRNALVVVASSFVAFSWNAYGHPVFTVTGETSRGLPPFRPPPTSDTTANGTVVSFGEIVEDFGGALAVIPFMGLLESIAIAKAFASQNDYRIDANQELLAIGVTNIMGSFVSAYPVTGSFGRQDSSELPDWCLHSSWRDRHQCGSVALPGVPHAGLLLHPQSLSSCCYHLCGSSHGGLSGHRQDVEDTQTGPAAVRCDVPDELLAGAVRHCGRCGCIWSPAALQHGKTTNKGV